MMSDETPGRPRIFDFSPADFAQLYRDRGYAHIKGGMAKEFLEFALEFADRKVAAETNEELEERRFTGKKRQYLMEFDPECDFPGELYNTVADVTGLDATRMMISERHIKIYDDVAPADPPAHKDRLASEVTVGLGLRIPDESWLKLYPETDLEVNPFQSAREWRDSLDEEDLPENRLAGVEPVRVDMRPGDVVMFAGSVVYHERVNPANTWVLYIKLNSMRLDPLAEDPHTGPQRERSLSIIGSHTDDELLDVRLEVSPRLEKISRHYTRNHFAEVVQGYIMGEKEIGLSEDDLRALLLMADGQPTLRETIVRMGHPFLRVHEHVAMFRRLASLGVIDFLS